ncbi:MAG: oligosaccharide flippase family protein [Bacteroidota bacterium]
MSIKKNTVLVSFSNSFQVLITLISGIILARALEKTEFGEFQQSILIVTFITSLTNGIPAALSFYIGKEEHTGKHYSLYKRFFSFTLLLALLLATLSIIVFSCLSGSFNNSLMSSFKYVLAGILFFKTINNYFLNFYTLIQKISYYTLVKGLYFLANIFILILVYLNVSTLESLFYALILIEFATFIILYKHQYSIGISFKDLLIKEELSYVFYMALSGMAGVLNVYIDKFMISGILSPKEFGEYQVGALNIPFIGIITASIITVLTPIFSRLSHQGSYNEIAIKLKEVTKQVIYVLIPIFIFCILFGQDLIEFFFSEKFKTSGLIFQIYTGKNLLAVVIFGGIMGAIGLQKYLLITQVINALLNIIGNYILIEVYGQTGAAISTLIVTYLGYIVPIYTIWKKTNLSFFVYFPLLTWIKTTAICLITCISLKLLLAQELFSLNIIMISVSYYAVILFILNALFGIKNNLK